MIVSTGDGTDETNCESGTSRLVQPEAFGASEGITGSWDLKTSIAGHAAEQTCAFTQQGSHLSGTCKTEQGNIEITGKVEGNKLSGQHNSDYNGTQLTIVYNGTADSKSDLTGSIEVQPLGATGTFTGKRVK